MMSVVKSPQIAMYGQKPYASSAEYRPPLTIHGRPQLSRSELALIALSENLSRQIGQNPHLEILGEPRPMEFDSGGNLVDMLVPAGEVVATH